MSTIFFKRRLALCVSILAITLFAFGLSRVATSWLDAPARFSPERPAQVMPTS